MTRHKVIPLDSPIEWKAALSGIEHAFAHTWENCYAMQLTTGFRSYLYCFEADNVRIVCPIAERIFDKYVDIVTPYGFSGFVGTEDYPGFSEHWSSFVDKHGYVCGYIALNPAFENATYFRHEEAYQFNSLYFLDLTLSYEELFAKLDSNRKRQLRDWEKAAPSFILDRRALTEFLLTTYPSFVRRVNASAANRFTRETLTFLCGLDGVFMVGAGEHETIEAVYLFSYTPYAADWLLNVALVEGRHYAAALLWYGLNHLKSLRIPVLNLGGGIRENDGVAQFKQRFGAKRVPFRCLKQVYNRVIYDEICHRRNAIPADTIGYFPAYRAP